MEGVCSAGVAGVAHAAVLPHWPLTWVLKDGRLKPVVAGFMM